MSEFSEPRKKGKTAPGRADGRDGKNSVADGVPIDPSHEGRGGPEYEGEDPVGMPSRWARDGVETPRIAPSQHPDRSPFDGPLHPDCSPVAAGSSADAGGSPGQVSAEVSGHHAREVSTEVSSAHAREVRILAVDIGAHGAAALLDGAGGLLDVVDLPTLEAGPACRPEISPHLFAGIVRRWSPARAWVEWIGPRAGDRPAGAFAFGGSRATVETALAVLGVPFRTIVPAQWKRACSIPAGKGMKDMARARAIERWPRHAELFARVKDHDRAEAALIGWAGLQREAQGR